MSSPTKAPAKPAKYASRSDRRMSGATSLRITKATRALLAELRDRSPFAVKLAREIGDKDSTTMRYGFGGRSPDPVDDDVIYFALWKLSQS